MIPAQTQPLAKAIRTLEGILVAASNVVIAVASVPSLHALDPKIGAGLIVANNIALLVQRGTLKAKALDVPQLVQAADALLATAQPAKTVTPASAWDQAVAEHPVVSNG